MKKILFLLVLILFSVVGLYAADTKLAFSWSVKDNDVVCFRYVLDDEITGEWTIVDASVTSVEFDDLPLGENHVLYVQASYDGETWSDSGMAMGDPQPLVVFLD